MDRASEFVIDVRRLGLTSAPGSWESIAKTVRAPEDLRIELIGVPAGDPVELDLRFESVVEGIFVSGSVRATARGQDARTLEGLELPIDVRIDELFVYEADPQDEESQLVQAGLLDLEPAVRDAVVMSLPFRPLKDGDEGEFHYTLGEDITEDEPEEDPRWAALKSVLNEKKES